MPLSEVKFPLFLLYIRLQNKNLQKTQEEKGRAENKMKVLR